MRQNKSTEEHTNKGPPGRKHKRQQPKSSPGLHPSPTKSIEHEDPGSLRDSLSDYIRL